MVIPTEEIKNLVDRLAKYSSAFADYSEAEYLISLRDELKERVEETYKV